MSQVTSQNALVKDSTVQTLNGKLDNLNATLGGNANIAPVFNTATAYSKGDMVNYNGDLYVFTANHSAGAWTGSDAVQTKVSSELSSLKSGLTNIGNYTDLGNVQGSDTITLSDAVTNFRFVQILIGYYDSGYPCYGQALLPVSALLISAVDLPITVTFTDINEVTVGRATISFLSATSVKVVNTSSNVYTRIIGIA